MSRPRAAIVAWGLWVVFAAGLGAAIPLGRIWDVPDFNGGFAGALVLLLAFGAYATVGAVVASRRPGNSIGWLFCGIGALVGVGAFSQVYAHYALAVAPGGAPGGYLAAWVTAWYWYPLLGGLSAFTLLLFPTGAPPPRRWRPLLWVLIAAGAFITVAAAVAERLHYGSSDVRNPIGIDGVGFVEETTWGATALVVFLVCLIGSLASVVARFHRSRGVERQQLKWFTFAGVIFGLSMVLGELFPAIGDLGGDALFGAVIALLPVSAGVAILKYRLYDIDRVINRTLVYGALTAMVAGAYALVALASATLGSNIPLFDNDLVVAGVTLAVAAAFGPLRRRTQAFVDRRFYRSRYDAARTVEGFSARLRDSVDLEALSADLLTTVNRSLQPAHASLWLRT